MANILYNEEEPEEVRCVCGGWYERNVAIVDGKTRPASDWYCDRGGFPGEHRPA